MDLKLDADELNTCVQCGLCLPHCPTFRVTGDETMSPRGRIALMRHVQDNDAPVTDEVVDAFATCVQCRGCEPACPSAVPYGHLIEQTRETLVDMGKLTPKWQQAALKPLASPKLLRAGSAALAVINKTGLLPDRLGLPDELPIRQRAARCIGRRCVDVHRLCHGRLATRCPPGHPTGDRGGWLSACGQPAMQHPVVVPCNHMLAWATRPASLPARRSPR